MPNTPQQAVNYLVKLANTTSKIDKVEILKQAYKDGCHILFEAFNLAYDKLKPFNVKKVPEVDGVDDDFKPTFTWERFLKLADDLHTRKLSGMAAQSAINNAAMACSTDEWNILYRRILIKDLRCGTTATLANNALKELGKSAQKLKTTKFELMAATALDTGEEKELTGEYYADLKMDGVRLIGKLDKKNNKVTMVTRSGHINTNFKLVQSALEKILEQITVSIVFDGEIMSDDFQNLMTQINRKKDLDTDGCVYKIFDVIPLEDFENDNCQLTQEERQEMLSSMLGMIQQFGNKSLMILEKRKLNLGTKEGQKILATLVKESNDMPDTDGMILKKLSGMYRRKRGKDWLKVKPFFTVDGKIVGFKPGNGKNAGKLGAVYVEGTDWDPKTKQMVDFYSSVGGGWSDDMREEIWNNQDKYKGRWIEVEIQSLTIGKNDTKHAFRHGNFTRFRDTAENPGIKL